MIYIEYEVIVKFNSDVKSLEDKLDVFVEILSCNYAIVSSNNLEDIEKLLEFDEIEYVEEPFILQTQDYQSFSSSGIDNFKSRYNLDGEGTLLGIIDSGIDHTLPIFKDENGESKILYYWDQSGDNNPPKNFKNGELYTKDNINEAPIYLSAAHGTHVAGICASIANKANLIVVKVGNNTTDTFSKSTEFMRALRFILDKAQELKKPVAINISYGTNEGSHRGLSLFEEFIDDMSIFWKNNIVVAAGNNAVKGSHKRIKLEDDTVRVEFEVGENESILNINIWPNYSDEFEVYIIDPSNRNTQSLSKNTPTINDKIGNTKIKGVYFQIAPYSISRKVTFELSSDSFIDAGVWTLVFEPKEIIVGEIDIYLPTSEGISENTQFLEPSDILTVTIPGTANKVITVGSYDSKTDIRSVFSGEGDFKSGVYKPDLLAPGEDIVSFLPGGTLGALTGTSMATPHVTGVCSLLMQWGIVRENDEFLYSQKIKALLNRNARRRDDLKYPNSSYGYGFLDMSNINLNSRKRNYKKSKKLKVSSRTKGREIENNIANSLLLIHSPDLFDELEKLNTEYKTMRLSEKQTIIFIETPNRKSLEEIMGLDAVFSAKYITKIATLGEITLGTDNGIIAQESIGVNFFKNNPNLTLTGRDTIIAVIDTGIDYLHEDFIYADRTSKILFLWDQSKEGNPPDEFYIGTEYINEDINKAIIENDNSLSQDIEGHGTMISGICAGLGNVNSEYEGVAPDANLIVVKLAQIDGNYNTAFLSAAMEYVYKKAEELDLATVVNIGVGTTSLAGYADVVNSEQTYFLNGVCTIAAAGNEGNTQTHTSGNIDNIGEVKDIEIQITEEEKLLRIELWVTRHDRTDLLIITPTGEESKRVNLSNYDLVEGLFDLEGTEYSIRYIYPTSYSGQEHTVIFLKNAKPGIWKIRLEGISINNGRYNIYLDNRVFLNEGTQFKEPTPNYTINYPGIEQDVITIGAYNSINQNIWPSSSRGPNIVDRIKPDIVAPGVNIIAPYPDNKYAKITGTSPATAHASGVVSLIYEYIIAKQAYPDKGFIQMIRTYMHGGANRERDNIYPNNTYGYGELDLKNIFEQLK